MAKFKKDGKKETPAISTASLPDIVFMLLFFFMVSTTMREVTLMIQNNLPQATQIAKLEKKSLVSNIYVGKPTLQYQKAYGTEPRIQLNDKFATLEDVGAFVAAERLQITVPCSYDSRYGFQDHGLLPGLPLHPPDTFPPSLQS